MTFRDFIEAQTNNMAGGGPQTGSVKPKSPFSPQSNVNFTPPTLGMSSKSPSVPSQPKNKSGFTIGYFNPTEPAKVSPFTDSQVKAPPRIQSSFFPSATKTRNP